MKSHLILIAHGSKDSRWRLPFENLEKAVNAELGEKNVSLCYMEFVSPTLEDVVKAAIANGYQNFKLLPLFMSGGGHVSKDIPIQVNKLSNDLNITMEVLDPIGENPLVCNLIKEVILAEVKNDE